MALNQDEEDFVKGQYAVNVFAFWLVILGGIGYTLGLGGYKLLLWLGWIKG